jgi:hypothetical protein
MKKISVTIAGLLMMTSLAAASPCTVTVNTEGTKQYITADNCDFSRLSSFFAMAAAGHKIALPAFDVAKDQGSKFMLGPMDNRD